MSDWERDQLRDMVDRLTAENERLRGELAEEKEHHAVWHRRYLAKSRQVARVKALHPDNGNGFCRECVEQNVEGSQRWPCPTIAALAEPEGEAK